MFLLPYQCQTVTNCVMIVRQRPPLLHASLWHAALSQTYSDPAVQTGTRPLVCGLRMQQACRTALTLGSGGQLISSPGPKLSVADLLIGEAAASHGFLFTVRCLCPKMIVDVLQHGKAQWSTPSALAFQSNVAGS